MLPVSVVISAVIIKIWNSASKEADYENLEHEKLGCPFVSKEETGNCRFTENFAMLYATHFIGPSKDVHHVVTGTVKEDTEGSPEGSFTNDVRKWGLMRGGGSRKTLRMAFRTEYFGQMRREKGVKKYKNCAEFIYELPLRDMVPVRGSPAPITTKPEWFFFCGLA